MSKRTQKQYDNQSISSLKGADRVRKRPAVIFGSDGIEGCEHSMFEILSNSIDEAREGHGERIIVTRFADGSIEVEDFGRGIPVDYNENEQRYNWELVFCELYAGGKYDNQSADSYEFSLGLNGLGLCATQYASEYMDVEIYRDALKYTLHFEHGENVGGLQKEEVRRQKTGTKIRWRPDLKVFTDIDIPLEYYADTIKRQAVVNPGVTFVLKNQTAEGMDTQEFFYEHGITDYLGELVEGEALTPVQYFEAKRQGRDREDKDEYRVKLSVAFCFSNRHSHIEYYHNSSWLEHGGSPERAVRVAFVGAIDGYLRQGGKYLKNESKITFADVEDCLVLVSSSFSTQTSYENQTKKAITNKFIYEAMTDFLKQNLQIYFIENPDDAQKIAEQVLINKRSRENAEKTRLNLKKKLAGSIDLSNRVQKFVDCRSRDVNEREIYIVEGDSALGACKLGRDAQFQAIIPVRGKILNCLKADIDRIFKSDIITDIFKVLGCGVELKAKANKELSSFDLSGLRWNKIVICTDADVDGFQIRTLILTMLYTLAPTLIERGFVYIAESPLYEINTKDKVYFAYNEAEKADALQKIGEQKYTIQRSKGLGENEPDMMWLTTMNPQTRRLIKVSPSEAKATAEMFELLLGDNLEGRKQFIADYGAQYLDAADLS
ncbi:MAG: DNA topoisomerase [Clostridiales bacterium]|uniref:DNA topoisomerase (ATP-hydrolyzing) n=1 Tax=Harryflintia acetispora TaxID=1849041 RepID=A0A9X8UJC7_9FIRM|nr:MULTISPECIES: toprim domain-containing protein [Oscillospiraceae]PWM38617.1 MAG: DNA topoisomerase [Clostridiales bacterium]RGB64683.1 DNA topoisomerase [Harryflintia acetispora]TCL42908.1 DNA gyrase subunit B [Harryflintia acetispora]